jgi:long-subunit acyl-CoA synthetase (AMP-forming)
MVGAMLKAGPVVEKYNISHVNTVVVGASNLSKEVANQFTNLIPGCKLVQGYGLTETTVAVTFENPGDIMFGSCGHLFPGCEGRLIDENGEDIVEHHRPGELLVRSPSIMLGYLDNEVATREMLSEDGWLRTGDLVEFRRSPAGHSHLFLVDRIKELIKVRVSISAVPTH